MTAPEQHPGTKIEAPRPEQEIAHRLTAIETNHNIRILHACESGSRAWGFASPDSDWDVRFIYVHDLNWYLSVGEHRDVIELPIVDDYDINGWELRKALRLLKKSNPVLLEWINSPIQYRINSGFITAIQQQVDAYYNPAACYRHYLNMARNNWRDSLNGPEVKLKKYLYVLRPVLACRWIVAEQSKVPVEFAHLLTAMPIEIGLRTAIEELLTRKQAKSETGISARIPEIDRFLNTEIPRLTDLARSLPQSTTPPAAQDDAQLDSLLRTTILTGL